jgi:hypothetical protein
MSWAWEWWIFLPVLIPCIILSYALISYAEVPRLGTEAEWQVGKSAAFVAALIYGILWAAGLTTVLGFLV